MLGLSTKHVFGQRRGDGAFRMPCVCCWTNHQWFGRSNQQQRLHVPEITLFSDSHWPVQSVPIRWRLFFGRRRYDRKSLRETWFLAFTITEFDLFRLQKSIHGCFSGHHGGRAVLPTRPHDQRFDLHEFKFNERQFRCTVQRRLHGIHV